MLIRICLIVAILGGLAVAGVDFFVLKANIDQTIKARDDFNAQWHTELTAHKKYQTQAENLQKDLTKTKDELTAANQAKADADSARADAEKALAVAQGNLKKTQADLDATSDKLAAWEALGITLPEAKKTLNSLRQVQDEEAALATEKQVIYAKCVKLQGELDAILDPTRDPDMPDGLRGKVLAVDPRYDFVVLNIGQKDGAVMNGKLLVNRNGKLVAKLSITDQIEPNRCIANVMPGWKLSDVMEGDEVFY
jgi:hypothetical protein